jgi:hypothetical protein
MKLGGAAFLLLVSLSACRRQPSPPPQKPEQKAFRPLRTDEKIVRATLALLASDGKPVCVERETFGSPLSIWRIATQGKLQKIYDLAWFPPKPFRPPTQPTLDELRSSTQAGQHANLVEPEARRDRLSPAVQTELQTQASALAPPEIASHRVTIRQAWAPAGVMPRWWPAGSNQKGCHAQYVLSGIKWNAHVAFVGVRVEHWGTVFALAPHGDDWRPIAQWGTWLY